MNVTCRQEDRSGERPRESAGYGLVVSPLSFKACEVSETPGVQDATRMERARGPKRADSLSLSGDAELRAPGARTGLSSSLGLSFFFYRMSGRGLTLNFITALLALKISILETWQSLSQKGEPRSPQSCSSMGRGWD